MSFLKSCPLLLSFVFLSGPLAAQGPPINLESPILLGFEGKAITVRAGVNRSVLTFSGGNRAPNIWGQRSSLDWVHIGIPYNFTEDTQAGIIIPYLGKEERSQGVTGTASGLGDISLTLKQVVFQEDALAETFRVALRALLTLPTGSIRTSPEVGAGISDYGGTVAAGWLRGRFGVHANLGYLVRGIWGGLNRGDGILFGAGVAFRVLPEVGGDYPVNALNVHLELLGESYAPGTRNGVADNNQGYNLLILAPGLQYVLSRQFLVESTAHIPVYRDYRGRQLGLDYSASAGFRFLFF